MSDLLVPQPLLQQHVPQQQPTMLHNANYMLPQPIAADVRDLLELLVDALLRQQMLQLVDAVLNLIRKDILSGAR